MGILNDGWKLNKKIWVKLLEAEVEPYKCKICNNWKKSKSSKAKKICKKCYNKMS